MPDDEREEFPAFCQEHWEPLVPEIEEEELAGLALGPLVLQAVLAHGDIEEEFEPQEGDKLDAQRVLKACSPFCCWLEDRERYSEGTEFEDDLEILVEACRKPLDDKPDAFWYEGETRGPARAP